MTGVVINASDTILLLAAGLQAGLLLTLGGAMAVSRLAAAIRLCGVGATVAYILNCLINSPAVGLFERPSLTWTVTAGLSATAGGLTWVMVLALFEDRPIRPFLFVPAVAVAFAAVLITSTAGAISVAAWWIANVLNTLVMLHALYLLARGRSADLVESRRRLRRPLAAACVAMALAQGLTLVLGQGPHQALLQLAELAAVALLTVALLEVRRALFEAAPQRAPRETADGALAIALDRMMGEDQAWREESLSIGLLASRLKVPEHRLRRLINGRLGYRNFPSFINAYRIEAAKSRLGDPAEAQRTVAEIAFDLGFTSLSPFNRAFKEATGLTPTAWRAAATADGN